MMRGIVRKYVKPSASHSLYAVLICTLIMPEHQALAHIVAHHKKHISTSHGRARLHSGAKPEKTSMLNVAVPEGSILTNVLPSSMNGYSLKEWDGQDNTLKNLSQISPALWSAFIVNGSQLETGCLQHWLRSLDAPANCGIPAGTETLVLAWDRSRLTSAPNWQDFWDIARQPGRRGLHFGARTTLEIALLADGVPSDNIYATLSTPAGIERAFHRLDLLRPYIIWWRTPNDARQIMQQSSALMTSAPLVEIAALNKHAASPQVTSVFEAQIDHSLTESLFWTVPQNVPSNIAQDLVSTLKGKQNIYHDHVTSSSTQDSLNIDDTFWQENGPTLEQRFLDWFGRNAPR